MIALFLVTFEMFMMLTKGKKGYSVMAAFLIALHRWCSGGLRSISL